VGRLNSGFDLVEVVSEYRALRASVLERWRKSNPKPHEPDVIDLTRFNESIDQSLTQAVVSYTQRVDQSRDLFMAILGHDLRNPLNSIAMSAAALPVLNKSDPETMHLASQIAANVSVMAGMISDLLDYTRTRLGTGMPVDPQPMDAGELCYALYDEFRAAHPRRVFRYQASGVLTGAWDVDRLRQALSNLMGNAVQHGDASAPIELKLNGEPSELLIMVRNGGPPIPLTELPRIFEPMIRGVNAQDPKQSRLGSMGLGLYIAREVVRSHLGRIDITSSEADGTAFTLHLPRNPSRSAGPG
jgi:signal transduction histidine kinase